MLRPAAILAVTLAASACSAEPPPPDYVVRLDLDQIAAATAAKDRATSPGFESLENDSAIEAPVGNP